MEVQALLSELILSFFVIPIFGKNRINHFPRKDEYIYSSLHLYFCTENQWLIKSIQAKSREQKQRNAWRWNRRTADRSDDRRRRWRSHFQRQQPFRRYFFLEPFVFNYWRGLLRTVCNSLEFRKWEEGSSWKIALKNIEIVWLEEQQNLFMVFKVPDKKRKNLF